MEAIESSQADVDLLDWEADSMAPMQRAQQLLPNRDPSPATSHDEAVCDSHSDDELNNTESAEDDEEPCPVKRERPFSSQDGPMHKKPKHRLQQRSTGQHRPRSRPHGRSLDQASRVAAVPSPQARPSAPHAMDTDMSPDCGNLDRSSRVVLPTLTEVTFRPHSPHCCSFTAVIRDGCEGRGVSLSQLARLIASISHVGKIDDLAIKQMEQYSFLLTGLSRLPSSRLSSSGTTMLTVAKANRAHDDATRSQLQYGRAVDAAGAVAPRGSEPSSNDHDGGLSDSDPDSSSDDDGCWSEDEQGRSSTRMNIPWDSIDELRLLAYKKEDMSWDWIFRQFPGRTHAAVRTRWNIVQRRAK